MRTYDRTTSTSSVASAGTCVLNTRYPPTGEGDGAAGVELDDLSYTIRGQFVQDVVTLNTLVAHGQLLGSMTTVPDNARTAIHQLDGVLGMGRQSAKYPIRTVFQTLANEGAIDTPMFSIYLPNQWGVDFRQPSMLYLGGVNPNHFQGRWCVVVYG